jgi:hypothetical protein
MNAVKQPYRLFKKRRKVVLREDLMELTKDINQALVLSQMLYWTEKIDDLNDLILEENKRLAEHGQNQIEYFHGWIWKSARQMKEELFHALSEDAIQRAFVSLSDKGIFVRRRNPNFKYDRTIQYRVDLLLLRRLLKEIGIDFTDFQLDSIPHIAGSITQVAPSNTPVAETIPEITINITTESNPLTPLAGGTETSAMASDSEDGLVSPKEDVDANAESGKSDDLFSRPPSGVKRMIRRERKNSPPTTIPTELDCRDFREAWSDFLTHRKEKKKPVTPTNERALLSKLREWGASSAAEALRASVINGWIGVFKPKEEEWRPTTI